MDKGAVEHVHETMQSAGRLADRVNCLHGKGKEMHKTQVSRGITLLSHIMKLLERILDKRLRERVEHKVGEEQLGFRKGRGTTDGMFSLRQLVDKRLKRQGHMALAFVDLEKALC